jgi:hypothetical protein
VSRKLKKLPTCWESKPKCVRFGPFEISESWRKGWVFLNGEIWPIWSHCQQKKWLRVVCEIQFAVKMAENIRDTIFVQPGPDPRLNTSRELASCKLSTLFSTEFAKFRFWHLFKNRPLFWWFRCGLWGPVSLQGEVGTQGGSRYTPRGKGRLFAPPYF